MGLFDIFKRNKLINIEQAIDIEGNVYNAIKIGKQIWTTENLKTTKLNDGTSILQEQNEKSWSSCVRPAYCWYPSEYDSANKHHYGALYNRRAVETGILAPKGWHIPSRLEWQELRDYLIAHGFNCNGTKEDNLIAKAMAATLDWISSPKPGAIGNDLSSNNKCGFSALPSGFRTNYGSFRCITDSSYWWSSPLESDNGNAIAYSLHNDGAALSSCAYSMQHGFSVRLIKD